MRRWGAFCAAAVAGGVVLRFWMLGRPLWGDEVLTINIARCALADIPERLTSGGATFTPPLYYLLLHLWSGLAGTSEASLHLSSALLGSAGIAAVWWAGRRLWGSGAGLAAAALLAVHPFHIAHSQELRPYTLIVLLGTLSFVGAVEALRTRKPRWWLFFTVVNLANLYTHYYAFFLFLAELLWIGFAFFRDEPRQLWKPVAAGGLILVGYSPWWVGAFAALYKTAFFLGRPCLETAGLTAVSLSGIRLAMGESVAKWGAPYSYLLLAGFMAAALLAVRELRVARERFAGRLMFICLTTLAVPVLVSFIKPIYDPARHSIVILPFLCLLLGAAVRRPEASRLRWLVLALVLFCGPRVLYGYFTGTKAHGRDIADYIRSQAKADMELIVVPRSYKNQSLAYYYPEARGASSAPTAKGAEVIAVAAEGVGLGRLDGELVGLGYRRTDERTFGRFAQAAVYERRHQ